MFLTKTARGDHVSDDDEDDEPVISLKDHIRKRRRPDKLTKSSKSRYRLRPRNKGVNYEEKSKTDTETEDTSEEDEKTPKQYKPIPRHKAARKSAWKVTEDAVVNKPRVGFRAARKSAWKLAPEVCLNPKPRSDNNMLIHRRATTTREMVMVMHRRAGGYSTLW
jgi:hypothetical protein